MNKENLELLAKLLERKVDPAHFDMSCYFTNGFDMSFLPKSIKPEMYSECGTVACAVGHGPLLFPVQDNESWPAYTERVFGLQFETDPWRYCFGCHWAATDNTPQGAAARIRKLIENDGRVPNE